ncbi:serine hydrolase domain-containing protein [Sphingomonas sp.]|uniref:serine hydrolase domain-containing protein n=1 Tax=Sphingomonas sp. TaxID=28214 RepID=UPI002DD6813B|nr:serine hydrolase domain-containing protein [Sphingomonas sp.]
MLRISLFALVAGGSVVATLAPAQDRPDVDPVDRLFERWDRVDTPGMTIAILRDGKAADTRSYGMASIEHSIPNAPQTAYPLASVSKQFTAFAIHLLVGDGKLSLTDDVRKYVPELPDHGDPITLEMLIHHTSGLRETSGLLDLQGYGPQDAVSRQQALDLLWRQRTLNARPGSEYLYSNSGYLLLGLVIERVSGMSLGDFWQRRIFEPFDMARTRASAAPTPIVLRRASGYGRVEDRYTPRETPDVMLGPSGIISTVGDMAKWMAVLDSSRAGSHQAAIAAMMKTGTLSDGTPITYASGLHREHYRGLPFIEHSGRNWGYKADVLHFPTKRLTIIILANADDSDPPSLAFKVADIVLKGNFPIPQPKPPRIAMPVDLIDRYVGTYAVATGTTLQAPGRRYIFRREDFIGATAQLAAFSATGFFSPRSDFRAEFMPASEGGASQRVVIRTDNGDDFVARRVAESAPEQPPDLYDLGALVGDYWSSELGVIYQVKQREGKLWLRYPRGEYELRAHARNVFLWRQDGHSIRFVRAANGACGFFLSLANQRVRDLRFSKVALRSEDPDPCRIGSGA